MPRHDLRAAPPAAAPRTAERTVSVRLAVAQVTVPRDPADPGTLRESGAGQAAHA